MTLLPRPVAARHALPLALAALLCLLVAITALGIARLGGMEHRLRDLADTQRVKTGLLSSMLRNIHDRSELVREAHSGEGQTGRERESGYDALARDYERTLGRWDAYALSDAERHGLAAAHDAEKAVVALHREIFARLARSDRPGAAELDRARAETLETAWEDSLYAVLEASGTNAMAVVDEARDATRHGLLTLGAVGTLLLVLGTIIAILVTRKVRRAESEVEIEKELAEVTLHSIGDGVVTTDADGRVEYLNPVAEKYTGWRNADARGRTLADVYRIVDERMGVDLDPLTFEERPDGENDNVAVRLVDRDGAECPIRYSHAPIRSRDGRRLGMIFVFHDISQVRAMAQQLLWQASHDALTGLVNRREFERRLAELADLARAQGRQHVLMYMDLDNFKAVNDTCGHVAGDELLRQLTAIMLTRMRGGSDTLARLGGDEFGVLLQSCPVEQGVRIANGIREAVREFRFVWQNKTFSVGVSIGIVPIDADSPGMNMLLARADACCYEAKNRGRDRVQVCRPDTDGQAGRTGDLQLVSQINQAFEAGRFRLYSQAIVPLHGDCGGETHYEVLVRMIDAEGKLLPPDAFIPAAERYNLLTSIERWVISSLVEHLHRLHLSGGVPANAAECGYYAVNISGASLNDRSFPDFLRNLLTRYALPPGLLGFEITETTAIASLSKAAELIHEFKTLGCRFSLDDFGTGMSSFAYLKYLPVDTLKIAGMFVKDMASDPMDAAIVEAIHRISHILGIRTVAESVEDAATLDAVRRLGIDFAQGYHIAEPEPLGTIALPQPAASRLQESP
jgi:diguanylate cyclase (GGDEF)-like protein/PAS domain S-box-containing protein